MKSPAKRVKAEIKRLAHPDTVWHRRDEGHLLDALEYALEALEAIPDATNNRIAIERIAQVLES